MENYFQELKKKLEKISFEHIKLIDNSSKHKNINFFSQDKYHLHLIIKSPYLNSISRLSAQKLIMTTLKR